jgi:hypothetical protein
MKIVELNGKPSLFSLVSFSFVSDYEGVSFSAGPNSIALSKQTGNIFFTDGGATASSNFSTSSSFPLGNAKGARTRMLIVFTSSCSF